MKEFLESALDEMGFQKVDYGDIRIVNRIYQYIVYCDGKVDNVSYGEDLGFGIRVLKGGCWGFSASSSLTKDEVIKAVRKAVKIAEESARFKKEDIRLAEAEIVKGKYKTEIEEDPFKVSLEEKINLLAETDEIMHKVKGIRTTRNHLFFKKEHKFFASTEETEIEQEIYQSGGRISATAVKDGLTGERSYEGTGGKTCGYELIRRLNLKEEAQRVAEEAVALLSAKECPEGEMDVILDGSTVALTVHETVGHPTELDRVFGYEVSLAGTTHLTPDKLGKFKFASEIVNIVQDATAKGGLGTFGYDDEGIPAQKTYLIKDGIFAGYLMSRETAIKLGLKSNGTMRADGWSRIPLIRMTNINLLPGNWELEDLIKDTKDGIYLVTATSPSIDDKRLNFSISAEIGWRIRNGKLCEMIRRPFYGGISYEVWRKCDAICNEKYWDIWGIWGCGKGDPMQEMQVGHGASPLRFRKVKVGKK